MSKSISDLIMEYFKKHPSQDLEHGPVVDWVSNQYLKNHTTPPRDPWRAIRSLHDEGILIQVRKGVYRYEPDKVKTIELFKFSPNVKEEIFKRNGYKCVVCGKGKSDGVEIHADHIRPKNRGGDNSLENGQTLCTQHNNIKKNYSQTEAGKRYFIKMYETAKSKSDEKIIKFCKDVFDVYDKHQINGHISRPNGQK